MPTKIITKNGSGAPDAADLEQGELAVDLTNKRLYTEDAGGNVIEVGTSPSTIDINAGSIDGVTLGTNSAVTSAVITTADINGGTIDDTTIGGSTPAAGSFTTLSNTGNATLQNLSSTNSPLNISSSASDDSATLDASGNLLVGQSSTNNPAGASVVGHSLSANGFISSCRNSDFSANFGRTGTDGNIAQFLKNGSTVGSIGNTGTGIYFARSASNTGVALSGSSGNQIFVPSTALGAFNDNSMDLGFTTARWDDIYATNGTIQTSDRNEKQDIEELSEAEQRVAVAAKGLLRKFRWIKRVEEKGDDARIHFGIIAQDLQAAFKAEGLDAGRYAMFIHSEWWETQTEVPAVEAQDAVYETVVIPAVTEERLVSEAVLDEEGNEIEAAVYETVVVEEETTEERLVSEAVEAKEAYTRTDTYDTEEEAPEGAVKRSRMGVRYSELLAFIIAAI